MLELGSHFSNHFSPTSGTEGPAKDCEFKPHLGTGLDWTGLWKHYLRRIYLRTCPPQVALALESLSQLFVVVGRLLANAVSAAGPPRARPHSLPTRRPPEARRTLAGEPRRREAADAAVEARPRVACSLEAVASGEVACADAFPGSRGWARAAAPVEAKVLVTPPQMLLLRQDHRLGPMTAVLEIHSSSCVVH